MKIVVVGAGAVGLSCAYYAAQLGASVTIVDRRRPGAGASLTNAGWIVPSMSQPVTSPQALRQGLKWLLRPGSPLAFQFSANSGYVSFLLRMIRACAPANYRKGLAATAKFNQLTRDAFDDLAAEGVAFLQHREGLLMVFLDDHGVADYFREMEALQEFGNPPPQLLHGQSLLAREPALRDDVVAGIFCSGERHVDPTDFVRSLTQACAARGVMFALSEEVMGVSGGAVGRGLRVTTRREDDVITHGADHVVVAAGVESARIARMLGARLPLIGGGGYGYDFPNPPSSPRLPIYLTQHRVAVTPLPDRLRMSGAMEFTVGTKRVTNLRRARAIGEAGQHYLRDWTADRSTRPWSGLRPMTPDGLPLIGNLPGTDNVTVATGHAMLGITLAPVTGKLVAASIVDRQTFPELAPFDPRRFC